MQYVCREKGNGITKRHFSKWIAAFSPCTINTLRIFFCSLHFVFSRMIMLNGVYYKQNAVKIWQIISKISGTSSWNFFGITKRTNVGWEIVCCWFYMPAFVCMCGLRDSLLAHSSLLWHNVPFIYNLVYINRLKTAPIHACLQSVKNTHSRSFIHSHELMRKLKSTPRELKKNSSHPHINAKSLTTTRSFIRRLPICSKFRLFFSRLFVLWWK